LLSSVVLRLKPKPDMLVPTRGTRYREGFKKPYLDSIKMELLQKFLNRQIKHPQIEHP
jgi:hypothetical protein